MNLQDLIPKTPEHAIMYTLLATAASVITLIVVHGTFKLCGKASKKVVKVYQRGETERLERLEQRKEREERKAKVYDFGWFNNFKKDFLSGIEGTTQLSPWAHWLVEPQKEEELCHYVPRGVA